MADDTPERKLHLAKEMMRSALKALEGSPPNVAAAVFEMSLAVNMLVLREIQGNATAATADEK